MNYAYWRKCDFQVHSPRDPGWDGSRPGDEAELAEWAEEFVDQCFRRNLRAVALTDHHETVMVPYVKEAIRNREACDSKFDLWFFPGMEITVSGNKQCIIIFDADLSEGVLNNAQARLGIEGNVFQVTDAIARPVRPLNVTYPQIAGLLDELENLRGKYIILPNVSQGGKNTVLAHGLHNDFRNMTYVGGYLDQGQTIDTLTSNRGRLSGNDFTWSRRYIYPLPTSDSRSASYCKLGTNDTWIKIAEPTAEAIRQAFLAHQSRIRIKEPKLPSFVITKMQVRKSTILEKMDLSFSPEYNALIGGRGTGKSTFLEYLAFALGRSSHDMSRKYTGTDRMKDLITLFRDNGGRISLEFQMDNSPFRIERGPNTNFQPQVTYENGMAEIVPVEELRRQFPTIVYSQGELAEIGGSDASKTQLSELLQFVDPDYKQRNNQFDTDIRTAKTAVRSAIQAVVDHWTLRSSLRQLKTQRAALKQRVEAMEKMLPKRSEKDEKILVHFDKVNEFNSKVTQASKHSDQILENLNSILSELRTTRNVSTDLKGVAEKVQRGYRDLYNTFESRMMELVGELSRKRATLKMYESEWKVKFDDARIERNDILQKVGAQKNITRQIIQLREGVTQYDNKITDLRESIVTSGDPSGRLDAELGHLRQITDRRDGRTREWAESIEDLSNGKIKAIVRTVADIEEIRNAIDAVAAKTGSREATRRLALDKALKTHSATEFIDRLRNDCLSLLKWRKMEKPYGEKRPSCSDLMSILGDTAGIRESVTRLMSPERVTAIATAVAKPEIALSYCEGDREISFEKASEGQRAAALLFMLLEQSGGPLIIDQPEGDLDNKIITELTGKLHNAKEKRQLVFASHNANLVVNGSAELVGYLEVNEDGGRYFECTGAIDKSTVRDVITSTMEGGEKAFRDRQEKYGY